MKKIYKTDPWLEPYKEAIEARHERILKARSRIVPEKASSLSEGVNNHLYYGLHKEPDGSWVIREWAPNASRVYLIGAPSRQHVPFPRGIVQTVHRVARWRW